MKKEFLEYFLYKKFNLKVIIIDAQFYEFKTQGRLDVLIEDSSTKSYDFFVSNKIDVFENSFLKNLFDISNCEIISFFIVNNLSIKNLISTFKKNGFKVITPNINQLSIIHYYAVYKYKNSCIVYFNFTENDYVENIEFIKE